MTQQIDVIDVYGFSFNRPSQTFTAFADVFVSGPWFFPDQEYGYWEYSWDLISYVDDQSVSGGFMPSFSVIAYEVFSEIPITSGLHSLKIRAFPPGITWHADLVNNTLAGFGQHNILSSGIDVVFNSEYDDELFLREGDDYAEGGGGADRIDGGSGHDILFGGAGNDTLIGGTDNDAMSGDAGNDQYFVDNPFDVVNEAMGEGAADRVFTSVSYTLTAGQEIEVFTTTLNIGVTAINLTGNALNQTIAGNAGVNVLNGGGGTDTLHGYGGNDQYFVDSAGDVVNEAAGAGSDRVFTSVSYTLTAGQAIEAFTTTNNTGLTAINLTGNALNQTIAGNAGNNILNGGAGNDTLHGFGGNDSFVFNTALNAATNVDTIADFAVVDDTLLLENAVFTGLAAGTLTADAFRIGAAAADADDRIIYNSATGHLIFDSNGNAAGGATQFAKLAAGLALTNADFFVM